MTVLDMSTPTMGPAYFRNRPAARSDGSRQRSATLKPGASERARSGRRSAASSAPAVSSCRTQYGAFTFLSYFYEVSSKACATIVPAHK